MARAPCGPPPARWAHHGPMMAKGPARRGAGAQTLPCRERRIGARLLARGNGRCLVGGDGHPKPAFEDLNDLARLVDAGPSLVETKPV